MHVTHLLSGQIQAIIALVQLLHKLAKGHVNLAPLAKFFIALQLLLHKQF